jgi:prepilin-type N-terminal cleavage/methylation domain-containing protein
MSALQYTKERHAAQPKVRPSPGFTIIEITIVLVVISVLLVAILAPLNAQVDAVRRNTTKARLDAVDRALVLFAQRNMRLPCPADGTLDSTSANNGVENRNAATGACNDNQRTGVVPFQSLGIGETEATDGRDLRFTFRIGADLAKDNALDMTRCDPVGAGPATSSVHTSCNNSCTAIGPATNCTSVSAFLTKYGLSITDTDSGTLLLDGSATTGAAYVLIAHGVNQGGAYTRAGVQTTANPASGTNETANHNNQALRNPPAAYFDGNENNNATTAHFDDIVRRPTVQAVIDAAGLGPRLRP